MQSSRVLEIFSKITEIPRESGHEEQIISFLQNFAATHNLECKTDKVGNVLISKSASAGKEDVPVLVLQSHSDMVCDKKHGCDFDFSKDRIQYVIEDGWMIAKDTTLGADDGLGVALSLALLESELPMGRIECLFTVSEETSMVGAENLENGFFSGKTLINLDSEDDGEFFIGCAGGECASARFSFICEDVAGECIRLTIDGGLGGHSGDEIHKDRMNAIQQMARFLYSEFHKGLQLIDIEGGSKHNAIPHACTAVVAVPSVSATKRRFAAFGRKLHNEFHTSDPGVFCESEVCTNRSKAVDYTSARNLIIALFNCPNGPVSMSQDIKDLVETSTNLASIKKVGQSFFIETSQRSSCDSALEMIGKKVEANFVGLGAKVRHYASYPGWEPDVNSHILEVFIESYRKLFKDEPKVKAIHAGLECGLFLEKFHNMDMISVGPTVRNVHCPGEKVELATVDRFVDLLVDVVCNFR